MTQPYPTLIPGLRSPFDTVGDLVYFARLLDKIRLLSQGKLPEPWASFTGTQVPNSFDGRCCKFLEIPYDVLKAEVLKGCKNDDALLEWCYENGKRPTSEQIEIWNGFMTKRGWRDSASKYVDDRLAEIGLPLGTVQTVFEFIDLDEGRLTL